MGLFDSIVKLTKDITDIALAPVEIAVDITRVVTKPIADEVKEVVKDIKDEADDGKD